MQGHVGLVSYSTLVSCLLNFTTSSGYLSISHLLRFSWFVTGISLLCRFFIGLFQNKHITKYLQNNRDQRLEYFKRYRILMKQKEEDFLLLLFIFPPLSSHYEYLLFI